MRAVRSAMIIWWLGLAPVLPASAAERAPSTYYYFVFSNPVAGHEDEFNRWYDQQHAPDVVSIPGFVNAQRFVLAAAQLRPNEPAKPKYLVVYQIVTQDLASVRAEVNRRLANGQTRMSSSFDGSSALGLTYQATDQRTSGAGRDAAGAKAGSKQTYYQFVFADPVPGRDQQFNDWYETHHAPDVASVPGFVSWQRARLADLQMNPVQSATRYLMLFQIRTSDIGAVFDEFRRRAPSMSDSPAFDGKHVFGYTYRAIGPLLDAEQIRRQRTLKRAP